MAATAAGRDNIFPVTVIWNHPRVIASTHVLYAAVSHIPAHLRPAFISGYYNPLRAAHNAALANPGLATTQASADAQLAAVNRLAAIFGQGAQAHNIETLVNSDSRTAAYAVRDGVRPSRWSNAAHGAW